MISTTGLLAAFACALSFTSATTLTSRQTKNNAIYTPGLNELVPVGTPYKITWKPDVPGLVNIYLLRGPAENLRVLSTIAEGIQNTGSFLWTPDTSLEDDKTHYGLNLTMPAVPGEFQYSTQFGISNPKKHHQGAHETGTGNTTTSASTVTSLPPTPGSTVVTSVATDSAAHTTPVGDTTHPAATTSSGTSAPTSISVTGAPYPNGTVTGKTSATVAPTGGVHANKTTGAGKALPSSGANGQLTGALGAVVLAFGALWMV